MSRSIGLAYAITGAAVASALIVITASTTGLFEDASASGNERIAVASGQRSDRASDEGVVVPAGEAVEYVYVDEPASTRRGGERGPRDQHEELAEHEEHEDDDD